MGDLPLKTRLYTVCLVLCTGVFVFAAWHWTSRAWTRDDIYIAVVLIVAIFLAARYEVSFPQTSVTFSVSVDAALHLAAGLLLGPFHGPLISIAAEVLSNGPLRRQRLPLIKIVVNVANMALSTLVGATIYYAIADPNQTPLHSLTNTVAVILSALGFTLVNIGALSIIVAPVVGTTAWAMWKENFKGFYVEILTLPTLGTMVVILAKANPLGVALLAVPLAGPHMAVQALKRNQEQTQATMERLADALERRDPYTHQHSVRVTSYVKAILDQLPQTPRETAQIIIAAARIHDLGKVATNDSSLNKPGALTEEERREMQAHAGIGADIVAELDVYRQSAAIVRHHHERWDGRGYPDGLAGEEIPLGARIIAVADTYDAMTSDRVYRKALTTSVALAEIRRGSGSQFDPQIVAAFERAMNGTSDESDVRVPAAPELDPAKA